MIDSIYTPLQNNSLPGHSVPFISLGAFILIFGFFAFNGGSQAKISDPEDGATVALAIVNTLLGCIGGGLSVLFIIKIFKGGNWSLVQLVNGCLAGGPLPMCPAWLHPVLRRHGVRVRGLRRDEALGRPRHRGHRGLPLRLLLQDHGLRQVTLDTRHT